MQKIFYNNLRIVRALEVKYKLQENLINFDGWKKKIDDYYQQDREGKCMAIIETLRHNQYINIFEH